MQSENDPHRAPKGSEFLGTDTVNQYSGGLNAEFQHDIRSFASENRLSGRTGEPVSDQSYRGAYGGDSKPLGFAEDVDLGNRFSSVVDDTKNKGKTQVGTNEVGGNMSNVLTGAPVKKDYDTTPSQTTLSTDLDTNTTARGETNQNDPGTSFYSTSDGSGRNVDQRDAGWYDGSRRFDKDLSTQVPAGRGVLGMQNDVTNQRFYPENTGEVKSTLKLGQDKDRGQQPMESIDPQNWNYLNVNKENEEEMLKQGAGQGFDYHTAAASTHKTSEA